MKVVRNKTTGRLVYRESPDFPKGYGILNAALLDLGEKHELEEITVTAAQWEAELELRRREQPPALQPQIDALTDRVRSLEAKSIQ